MARRRTTVPGVRYTMGIDPGKGGGIAVLDQSGYPLWALPMPATQQKLLTFVAGMLRPCRVVIEHVSSSPQMGVVSAFEFGRQFERVTLACVAAALPYDLVVPRVWQAALGISYPPKSTDTVKKNITKAEATVIFGGIDGLKVTHAVADALLIAEYGRRTDA